MSTSSDPATQFMEDNRPLYNFDKDRERIHTFVANHKDKRPVVLVTVIY
jgi:hypothetical protein